jgi:hypothetical protein
MPDQQKGRSGRPGHGQKKVKGAITVPSPPQAKETPQIPPRLLGIADAPNGGTPDGAHPSWRLALLDLEVAHEGSWSWDVIDQDDLKKVTSFLAQMEALTWHEVKAQMFHSRSRSRRKHHSQATDTLCPDGICQPE